MGSRCLQGSFEQHTITSWRGLNETALTRWNYTDIRLTLKLRRDLDQLNSTRLIMADVSYHSKSSSEVLRQQIWGCTFTYAVFVTSHLTSLLVYLVASCSAADWQFAFTREGKNVPFATAGDCYSAARCPQVRTTTAGSQEGKWPFSQHAVEWSEQEKHKCS